MTGQGDAVVPSGVETVRAPTKYWSPVVVAVTVAREVVKRAPSKALTSTPSELT
ncbi:hypothetical protein D3C74_467690 [compost metagenome]